jgi:hypothetical protein
MPHPRKKRPELATATKWNSTVLPSLTEITERAISAVIEITDRVIAESLSDCPRGKNQAA